MSTPAFFDHNLCSGDTKSVMVNLTRGFVDRDVGSNLVLPKVKGAYRSQVPLQVQMVDLGGKRLLLSLYAPTHHLRKEFPQSLRLLNLKETFLPFRPGSRLAR
ncbi:hypothetical protein ACKFKG_15440 [Phormidesmis sp. 146-35]